MNPQDLFDDIKAIKAQLEALSQRPAPATAKQLEQINNRVITLDARGFAEHVLPDLKEGLPNTIAIEKAADEAANRITQTADKAAKSIGQAAERIPRQVRVTGDIYGFTTFYAALAYGMVLVTVVFGAWLICNHYKEQAQESVIYQQAQEVILERNYYYNQIQNYKRNNPTYTKLFPVYDKRF
ncbi:hypothetical protein [Spirosoma utsteinense]|uniref:Uncharacterized protein n=1 Tax=Spirosoma utsteinense TaxID=2585773 RepID=A0ABR6WF11_9BACT|nr:hypothetical protein [Spirosoma utsteinense]MBC3795112.1 hypothetical protein [Spirosoma utsteinense]